MGPVVMDQPVVASRVKLWFCSHIEILNVCSTSESCSNKDVIETNINWISFKCIIQCSKGICEKENHLHLGQLSLDK